MHGVPTLYNMINRHINMRLDNGVNFMDTAEVLEKEIHRLASSSHLAMTSASSV